MDYGWCIISETFFLVLILEGVYFQCRPDRIYSVLHAGIRDCPSRLLGSGIGILMVNLVLWIAEWGWIPAGVVGINWSLFFSMPGRLWWCLDTPPMFLQYWGIVGLGMILSRLWYHCMLVPRRYLILRVWVVRFRKSMLWPHVTVWIRTTRGRSSVDILLLVVACGECRRVDILVPPISA